MVRTRSAGAGEPLERLVTPPKRTRKTKVTKVTEPPVDASAIPNPEHQTTSCTHPVLYGDGTVLESNNVEAEPPVVLPLEAFVVDDQFSLTPLIEETPSRSNRPETVIEGNTTATTQRSPKPEAPVSAPLTTSPSHTNKRHLEEPTDDIFSHSKRPRTQNEDTQNLLFMFPRRPEDYDEEILLGIPAKSYADRITRDRRVRELARRQNRLGVSPKRSRALNHRLDGPFGIETFSAQEKAAIERLQNGSPSPPESSDTNVQDQDTSSTETPRRGLFGSLRELGSAALSKISSPFSSSHTPTSAPARQPQTEPRRQRTPAWDIQYPVIKPVGEETPATKPAATAEEEETESEKKRKAFEAKFGKTNRAYDHLHTIPNSGSFEDLPYPVKKPKPVQDRDAQMTEAQRMVFEKFRAKKRAARGQLKEKPLPTAAPLFGPDSHFARGTLNPTIAAMLTGKRKFDEHDDPTASETPAAGVPSPQVQDAVEYSDQVVAQEPPATPAAKKQKTAAAPHTPRSALKAPGTIGRSGRSARFNEDPVASVKRMSPIHGHLSAGTLSPGNMFLAPDIDMSQQSDETILSDPSPRTMSNTVMNTGIRRHPGELLTESMQTPKKEIEFQWRDPNRPDWRPSLWNPQPNTFRFPDDDEEMPDPPEDLEGDNAVPPPSTPRMAHAELPKAAVGSSQQTASSASALEAANLERRRAEATKTKPRTSSRLAEVTSARSRSPSPPALDKDDVLDASDESAKTPSPTLPEPMTPPTWEWIDDTYQYISNIKGYPDFTHNPQKELIPSFSLKGKDGAYDDTVVGPDKMTEQKRQMHYAQVYDKAWADDQFGFDPPQTYEAAGLGTSYIHKLIRKTDAAYPELVRKCDERFTEEWDAHQAAIDQATSQGKILIATFPDRDGTAPLDLEEEEL